LSLCDKRRAPKNMRVIGGKFRSRPLRSLRGMDVRPTSDRLRETLFDVLAPLVEDSVWIDLFAGTGAVGIEALSRGARMVYFAEPSRKAAGTIRQNLKSLGIEEGYEVSEREAVPALRLLDAQAVSCDVCFLDPPYRDETAYAEVLGFLGQSRLLTPSSIVVAEHEKHFDLGAKFGALKRYRELRQGDAVLTFYRLG
jgi:16S rRNA (guanine966-N2)-methyltransferase